MQGLCSPVLPQRQVRQDLSCHEAIIQMVLVQAMQTTLTCCVCDTDA